MNKEIKCLFEIMFHTEASFHLTEDTASGNHIPTKDISINTYNGTGNLAVAQCLETAMSSCAVSCETPPLYLPRLKCQIPSNL